MNYSRYYLSKSEANLLLFLKHLKDLTSLKLNLKSREYDVLNPDQKKLNLGLKNLRYLTSVSFSLSIRDQINKKDMEILLFNLKPCKQYLQHLTLDFSWMNKVSNEAVQGLATTIQTLKCLSKLNLSLEICDDQDNKAVQSLASCFKSIKILTLHLHSESSRLMLPLSKEIENSKHLEFLSLTFPRYDFLKQETRAFFQELSHIHSLVSLKLEMSSSNYSIPEDFFKSLSFALQAQSQLRGFSLQINRTNLQGKWVFYLIQGLKHLKNLSELCLCFEFNLSLCSKDAEYLGQGLAELSNLSILKLSLLQHNLSQEDIQPILSAVGSLKYLTELDLGLDTFWPQESIIQKLKSMVSFFKANPRNFYFNWENLNALTNLKLNLLLRNFTDNDLLSLSQQISNMKQLTTLSLFFHKRDSSRSLKNGLQGIYNSFKHLPKLINLNLQVYDSSDQDLQDFLTCLKDLGNLQSLEMLFFSLENLSLEAAKLFIQAMEKLEKLNKLHLIVDVNDESEAQEVQHFVSGVNKLKSLTVLEYDLGNVESILPMDDIIGSLRRIKTLKSLICQGSDEVI